MKKVWTLALGFALLGILLYAVYVLITVAWNALSQANPQFSGAVATGAAALIVTVVTVVGGKLLERKAAIAKDLRDKKVPVYEDLLKFMFKIFYDAQQGRAISQEEVNTYHSEVAQRLMVWGSDEVVAAWVAFLRVASVDPKQLLLAVENVIASIRRDLGHSDANLKPGDLLSLFVVKTTKQAASSKDVEPQKSSPNQEQNKEKAPITPGG